jgi:hypothetical protein
MSPSVAMWPSEIAPSSRRRRVLHGAALSVNRIVEDESLKWAEWNERELLQFVQAIEAGGRMNDKPPPVASSDTSGKPEN